MVERYRGVQARSQSLAALLEAEKKANLLLRQQIQLSKNLPSPPSSHVLPWVLVGVGFGVAGVLAIALTVSLVF